MSQKNTRSRLRKEEEATWKEKGCGSQRSFKIKAFGQQHHMLQEEGEQI